MKVEYLDDMTGGGKLKQVTFENLIPLFDFNRFIIPVIFFFFLSATGYSQSMPDKLSPSVQLLLKKSNRGDEVKLLVSTTDSFSLKNLRDIHLIKQYNNHFLVSIKLSQLQSFAANKNVQFISAWHQPKEELTTGAFDLSLNKINLVHAKFSSFNGNGVLVSVKEQKPDTTDIDFEGRYSNTGTAAPTVSVHASIMATIIAGGANSSPFAKGVAWGSGLASSDFATLLPDMAATYLTKNVYVQNHSYGTAIENFYGADAAAYDASVYSIPALLHVFSAGNSGTSTSSSGNYNGITAYANLTGSFKMAKNILTVGHADSTNTVLPLSSRGPAYDGRIKPELVAFGEDGSSGAAALVSGTAALLQQAYKSSHSTSYPSAALVKAVLINSADDIGATGPDFISGYGSLNTWGAMQTITTNNFFEDAVSNGMIKNFSITVPSNAKGLKITVAWTDTAATTNATKALVNDVDALLVSPSGLQSWQPWVLNSKANKDSLQLPAIRGTDTLNNVEQITVDNPVSGIYQLKIKGTKIITAQQGFAVAYQVDTLNSFIWTYPSSTDIIKAGSKNFLRWQTNITGNAAIEYAADGITWQTITTATDAGKNYFQWTAPDTLTTALLRMRFSSSGNFVSDTFVISPTLKLATGFDCADSFMLYWNKLATTQYQLYQLGAQYLQPLLSTSDTFKVFQKQQAPSLYYAVAPKSGTKTALRSFTINYTTQGVGCYVVSFYALLQNDSAALLSLTLGTLYHVAEISFQKWTKNGFQSFQTIIPNGTLQSVTDAHLLAGINRYRVQVKLTNGAVVYSDEDQVLYFPHQPVIVFPNPSLQNEPIRILVKDQGVYAIKIYDVNGRLLKAFALNDINNSIPFLTLSRGVYFIKVTTTTAQLFTQKLVVY